MKGRGYPDLLDQTGFPATADLGHGSGFDDLQVGTDALGGSEIMPWFQVIPPR